MIKDSAPIIREYEIPLAKYNQILQRAGRNAVNRRSSLVTPSGTVVMTYEIPAPKKRKKEVIPVSVPTNSFYHLMPKSLDEVELGASRSSTNTFISGLDINTDAANNGFVTVPPDPSGAVGTTHVCYTINRSIDCYTKEGVQVAGFSTSLQNFFSPLSPENASFDPKIIWDQYENRFVAITLIQTVDPNISRVLLAVSATADPTGAWYFQSINAFQNVGGVIDCWFDYPGLAIDEETIYITGNYYTFFGSSYCNSNVIIIDKGVSGGIYAGLTSTDDNPNTNPAFNIYNPVSEAGAGVNSLLQPAHIYGAAPTGFGTYLISYSGYTNEVEEFFQVFKINNPISAPTFIQEDVLVGDIDNTSISSLPDAPQPNRGNIQTNDRRTLNAVWRDNALWTTFTLSPSSGVNVNQSTTYWAKLNANGIGNTIFDKGAEIGGEDIAAGATTFFSAIAVDSNGDAAIGFSASSPNLFAGAYVAKIDGSTGNPITQDVVKAGTSSYSGYDGAPYRWGDYSSMSIDPVTDVFWATHQAAVGGTWQVFVKEFIEGCFVDPDLCDTDNDGLLDGSDNCDNLPTVGLNFDGVDDYIEVADADELSLTGDLTIEVWVKATDFANTSGILGKTRVNIPAPFDFYLFQNSGLPNFLIGNGFAVESVTANTAPTLGEWTHLAVVKNGTTITHYLNGIANGTDTITGTAADDNGSMIIGSRADLFTKMKGDLDELRIWNVARTSAEINNTLYNELNGDENGLVAYYPFNEGIPSGNNSSLSTVVDQTGNGNQGSLINFGNGSIEFDGINDKIDIPYTPEINFASNENFTIELWAKTPATAQPNTQEAEVSLIESVSNIAGYPYTIRYIKTNNKITASRFDGPNNPSIQSTTPVNDNQWHHIAFVKDGSTLRLYIDGQEESSIFDSTTGGALGNNPAVTVGSRLNSFYWKGSMDELRFWNYTRSAAQINADMNTTLTGTESGLVGYYPLDECSIDNVNPVIEDKSLTDNDASANFILQDCTTSNWVVGAAIIEKDSDGDGSGDACDLCEGDDATGDDDMDGVCNDLDPDSQPACDGDMIAIPSTVYAGNATVRASQTISTNGSVVVSQGADIAYFAQEAITLTNGFQASGNFRAAIAACTNSSASAMENRTEVVELMETSAPILSLKVFPNPTSGITQIQYELSQAETVTIVVYNLQGKVIQTLVQGSTQQAGIHQLAWNASNQSGGMYIIGIHTTSESKIEKLMITK